MADKELFGISEQLDCSDCLNHGGDWNCDHVQCRKGADTISRQAAIRTVKTIYKMCDTGDMRDYRDMLVEAFDVLPSAQQESKYEYHYDHTDCIWYRPEARNRCPSTCAQYRDGWNDAMNYIFRDGKGYRPYRRDQKYEG